MNSNTSAILATVVMQKKPITQFYTPATCHKLDAENETNSGLKKYIYEVQKNTLINLLTALVREQLLETQYQEDKLSFLLKNSRKILWIEAVEIGSLQRLAEIGNIYFQEEAKQPQPIVEPFQLLELLQNELAEKYSKQQWQQLLQEMENHLVNAPLCCWFAEQWRESIKNKIKASGYHFLADYVLAEHKNDSALFFEQWASRGHPSHPCSKTKLGFSTQEAMHYSPEFHNNIEIVMAALRKDCACSSGYDLNLTFDKWFAQVFPDTWQRWESCLAKRGLSGRDYLPFPVHPWQMEHIISNDFQDYLQQGALHIFQECSLPAKATLSFRTVQPVNGIHLPHIKLSVAIQATSALRTISAASVENGPQISRLLTKILQHENNFSNRLTILPELYGLHINSYDKREKQLAVLFRDNPQKHLVNNELAVVIATLFECSPFRNEPLLVEFMRQVGATFPTKILHYFHEYVDIVLRAFLELYLLYGIALEGHQQNVLAVFANGRPVRMLTRDFGGLRIYLPRLAAKGIALEGHPDSVTMGNDISETRNKLIHTVFEMHLGEWTLALAKHFQMEEALFWREIKNCVLERFSALRSRLDYQFWQQEREAILEADWPCKNLLKMRLSNLSDNYIYTYFANPLAAV